MPQPDAAQPPRSYGIDPAERQKPALVWLTGLSGAGKTTLAERVSEDLRRRGYRTALLDGDVLRNGLNRDLGFSAEDRTENIRRAAEVGKLFINSGFIVLASFISPFQAQRRLVENTVAAGQFIEVFVDAPLEVVEQRDVKGLYRRARKGEMKDFTGIDSPYERPDAPDIHIRSDRETPQQSMEIVTGFLRRNGYIGE